MVLHTSIHESLKPPNLNAACVSLNVEFRRGGIFTARAYARAVLGVVILSVRPSVCPSVRLSHACIVTKLNDALQIFLYHTKGQSLCYLTPRVVGRRRPLPSEICVQTDPPPSKNAHFDRFPLITAQRKKFIYDEYKVDHGLSNKP